MSQDERPPLLWEDYLREKKGREGMRKLSGESGLTPQQEERRRVIRSLVDPSELAEELVERAAEGLRKNFEPVVLEDPRTKRNLVFEPVGDLEVEAPRDPYDYEAIREALVNGKTYGSRIYGTFRIRETNQDGKTLKVLNERRVPVATVPTPTFDRSYVVQGKQRILPNQFRRNAGVFTRRNQVGDLSTEFNVDPFTSSPVKAFHIQLDRSAEDNLPTFRLKPSKTKKKTYSAWDLAKALGASERDLRKAVGPDISGRMIAASTPERYERALRDLHKEFTGADADTLDTPALEADLRTFYETSKIDEDATRITLGQKTDRIDKDVVLASMSKLLAVANEEEEEDDRESLLFKRVMTPADLVSEAVGRDKEVETFRRGVLQKLKKIQAMERNPAQQGKADVVQVISPMTMDRKISDKMTSGMLQRTLGATNPLDAIAAASMTTLVGEGAITNKNQLDDISMKLINPSSVGYLDLVHTPESDQAGITLHVTGKTATRRKAGSEGRETGYSELVSEYLKPDGSTTDLSPAEVEGKIVGAFGQYELSGGKPKAKGGTVRAFRNGQPVDVPARKVDVWQSGPLGLLDVNSNLIPFQNSTQGNRVQYSDKQIQQAVPLLNREAPIVQVQAPGSEMSMEELLGEEAGAIRSPVDGEVVKIIDQGTGTRSVEIRPNGSRQTQTIKLPKNLPMGGKTPLDSILKVREGDKVSRGDVLADSTFTKDGKLALGVNLRTAYLPFKAATFEDAIAISQDAARKLTSEHMYSEYMQRQDVELGVRKYQARGPALTTEERGALDANGVIKVGTRVKPGQALMVGVRGLEATDDELVLKNAMYGTYGSQNKKSLKGKTSAFRYDWKHENEGIVTDVQVKQTKKGPRVVVNVKTEEPMQVGDKLYGRHGNKGVVAAILPTDQMPRNPDIVEVVNPGTTRFRVGQEITQEEAKAAKERDSAFETKDAALDILLNPLGVPSRMNPSQNFETFLAKIGRREGHEELVKNFGYDSNWDYVQKRLQDSGISDAEDLLDPVSGKTIRGVGVGTQYIVKAKQTVEDKNKARGRGGFSKTGLVSKGEDGAQALGELGLYGLLAQDAREVLRDAQLYKSENREEVWEALEKGKPLPPVLQEPQAFQRFKDYLLAAGVELRHDEKNSRYQLVPHTDEDVVKLARTHVGPGKTRDNVISDPSQTIRKNTGEPIPGGLFDADAVAGINGTKWARFELAQALPNPVYEPSIKALLNLKNRDFDELMAGIQAIEDDDGNRLSGARAIETLLMNVDLDAEEEKARQIAQGNAKAEVRSPAYKKLKTIQMLRESGKDPVQAFMRKQVPVMPSVIRGLSVNEEGDAVVGDLNYLYRDVGLTNNELIRAREKALPDKALSQIESGLYDTFRTLMHTEGSAPLSGDFQGITGALTGNRWEGGQHVGDHKSSLFKKEVVQRRQAFSARNVLTPDDTLHLDEAGIPKSTAVKLYAPDIQAAWGRANPRAPLERQQEFRKKLAQYGKGDRDVEVERYLQDAVKGQNVLLKRDPVLHKYGFQGFRVRLKDEDTVSIHPAVFGGYNADVDGDQMAIFRPISPDANKEIEEKLLPTKNLINPASGTLEYGLGHEGLLGISQITRAPKKGSGRKFADYNEAREAYEKQEIESNEEITISGKKTTIGREMFSSTLPAGMDFDALLSQGVVSQGSAGTGVGKKEMFRILERIATESPDAFAESSLALRTLGQEQATFHGSSLLMSDLQPMLVQERRDAEKKLTGDLQKIQDQKGLGRSERQQRIEEVFSKFLGDPKDKDSLTGKSFAQWNDSLASERPNTLTALVASGARGNWDQLKQILVSPTAVVDGEGNIVPVPVMRNYSEGLDPVGYVSAAHGARMGAVSKVIQVQEPGYLSKQVINTTMDQLITGDDCGTNDFVSIDASNPTAHRDLVGRYLASPVKVGSVSRKKGEMLSLDDVSELTRSSKGSLRLKVRSPLKCEQEDGVCQKCAGGDAGGQLPSIGTNIGIQAGQALGERSTQLALSTFHGGGVFQPGKRGSTNLYEQASSLLRMPSSMKGMKSTLASDTGTVKSVKENRDKGGFDIITQEDDKPNFFVPRGVRAPDGRSRIADFFRPGTRIQKGDRLSEGLANPRDLLDVTGDMGRVQDYMTDALGGLFESEGVQRRNIETVVRAMTSTVEIRDPAGAPVLPGQKISKAKAQAMKKQYPELTYSPVLSGVATAPRDMREDFLARMNYTNLRSTLADSIMTGATTDYHSTHPIPAVAVGTGLGRAGRMDPDKARRGYY